MTNHENDCGEMHDEEEDKPVEKMKKHDSGLADLEKVTDYAEEKEIASGDIKGAISVILEKRRLETQKKAAYERELAKVQINKDDVDVIMNEYELPRTKAERFLRIHRGDVVEALTSLLNNDIIS
ncbi:unnamed protein product [Notodromas monacha]|uniref:Nascent polypeptide-associated complex subunit alpha-like UBA domain-containing protein n=1 Tax=Notodromas monacha TaxID=399045 RepID=A0A7R9BJ69_9CRUS|nr:unnamed protein product [Notodromas monacha]CAG0916505.1 unnamed protein product [Notodromas monacha]